MKALAASFAGPGFFWLCAGVGLFAMARAAVRAVR